MGRSQKKMLPSRHTLLILYQICNGVQDKFPSDFLVRHRSLIFFAFDPGVKPLDVHVAYQGTKVLSLENNSKCEDDYLIHYVLQKMCACVSIFFVRKSSKDPVILTEISRFSYPGSNYMIRILEGIHVPSKLLRAWLSELE